MEKIEDLMQFTKGKGRRILRHAGMMETGSWNQKWVPRLTPSAAVRQCSRGLTDGEKGWQRKGEEGKRSREGEIEVRMEEEESWRSQSPTKSQKRKSSKSSQSGQGLEVSWMVHQPLRSGRVGLIFPSSG